MLPFIVGALAGAASVIALSKKKEIKQSVEQGLCKAKEVACDVKNSVDSTIECIKTKKKTIAKKPKPKEVQ